MDANLVGATGDGSRLYERSRVKTLQHPKAGEGGPTLGADPGQALAGAELVTGQGLVDLLQRSGPVSRHQSLVALGHLVVPVELGYTAQAETASGQQQA